MNYRHHFHAGNFADVLKHALLVPLVRALQRKPGGLLLLDTHAGRGGYDLAAAARGDSLARAPEWPDGIGRLWSGSSQVQGTGDYLDLVRQFDRVCGNLDPSQPRYYPGSPWLLRALAREQDRVALCELHPEEFAALQEVFGGRRLSTQLLDGYTAVRAMLPSPERRALVLIDPSFEAQDEFARVCDALGEGLRRLPGGTFAVWYPLTGRAQPQDFFSRLAALRLPPAFTVEMVVAPHADKMRGCGLLIINPPWQFDQQAAPLAQALADLLLLSPGGGAELRWLVPER